MSETLDENKQAPNDPRPHSPLFPLFANYPACTDTLRTSEVLQCLDELILALDSSSDSTSNATSKTLGAICSRLDSLESQLLGESPRNGTPETERLASLEEKIDFIK